MRLLSSTHPISFLQVAVGVIKNSSGQILISLRDKSLHQGGLWEFPGGKIEASEIVEQALVRELKEELDITVQAATPLITINHQYLDLAVQLRVFTVERYDGEVKSCEGQPILWVVPDDLSNYAFPAANQPIVTAARLPHYYAILDDADSTLLLVNLKKILNKGIRLIQARLKTLSVEGVEVFLEQAYPMCKTHNAWLLLNSGVEHSERFEVDGIHLTSRHLLAIDQRPESKQWVAASCHNLEELLHAQKIGVDFVVIAPMLPTPTHPEAKCLGWEHFAELVAHSNLPVYALGGLSQADFTSARQAGGQGIAGIRAFLE
ncbi:Nudix family hydrolase [Methyloglobulus sp.]|uniref:Nudix family hydrolase n=1 Tax=Methyloglobulus sp. TaxID=2518622 RepID=UPI003988FDB1